MRDPYDILGVPRTADEAEIKRAYRKLAKKWHPDQNKASDAAARFAELGSAYEILGDADKRRAFDRGEIDAAGKPRFQGFEGFGAGPGGPGARGRAGPGGFAGFEFGGGPNGPFGRGPFGRGGPGGPGGFNPADIFANLFGQGGGPGFDPRMGPRGAGMGGPGMGGPGMGGPGMGGGFGGRPMKGADVAVDMAVTLEELAEGGRKRIRLPQGREVDVDLPVGVTDGQTIRLRGLGQPGPQGLPPGDAMMTVRIAPHPRFTPEGADLRVRVPVPLADAVLGGPVRIPTLTGAVETNVAPMTSSGRTLRLRGKGLPTRDAAGRPARGDLLATLDIVLPETPDPELDALMRRWREA